MVIPVILAGPMPSSMAGDSQVPAVPANVADYQASSSMAGDRQVPDVPANVAGADEPAYRRSKRKRVAIVLGLVLHIFTVMMSLVLESNQRVFTSMMSSSFSMMSLLNDELANQRAFTSMMSLVLESLAGSAADRTVMEYDGSRRVRRRLF
jgi:hypothetical protein